MKKQARIDPRIWWAVVEKGATKKMPCLAGRTREDARVLKEPDERVLKVLVIELPQ